MQLLASDETLRKKLFLYAYRLTQNLPDAKELAQDGMTAAIDPQRSPWDPDRQPNLLLHIGSVMNSLVANGRRAAGRHPFTPYDPHKDERADPAPTPEEQLLNAEVLAEFDRRLEELRARLTGDGLALGVLDLHCESVDAAAEQASRLGCDVMDVYRARERLTYHAKQVKET